MIKILLISDTHGHLDVINDLAEKTKGDLVIHAGDFGFYNDGSLYATADHCGIAGYFVILVDNIPIPF